MAIVFYFLSVDQIIQMCVISGIGVRIAFIMSMIALHPLQWRIKDFIKGAARRSLDTNAYTNWVKPGFHIFPMAKTDFLPKGAWPISASPNPPKYATDCIRIN